jgi:hypothetical protein
MWIASAKQICLREAVTRLNADFWRCLATALTLSIKLHE